METNLNFSRNLIKGKIAEIIFEQMFREAGEFTLLRLGYEYTSPELAQYQDVMQVKTVLDTLRHTPDFALISHDKQRVFIVEVKYQRQRDNVRMKRIAGQVLKFSDPSWVFVASTDGFYFDACNNVVNHEGDIKQLDPSWIKQEVQDKYHELLLEFEK